VVFFVTTQIKWFFLFLPRVGPHNNQKNENEKLARAKKKEEIGIKPSKKSSPCVTQARARDLNQKRDRRYTDTQ